MKKMLNLLFIIFGICVFCGMFFYGLEKQSEYDEYKNNRICELYPEANCGGQR